MHTALTFLLGPASLWVGRATLLALLFWVLWTLGHPVWNALRDSACISGHQKKAGYSILFRATTAPLIFGSQLLDQIKADYYGYTVRIHP